MLHILFSFPLIFCPLCQWKSGPKTCYHLRKKVRIFFISTENNFLFPHKLNRTCWKWFPSMSTFFAFIRNSTSLKNHSDFKSDDEGIGYICLFVFVKMLVWVCICQNVCLHLSKCLFVFVKMFVCIRQNVCLFTWRRERALPAEEVLHQVRLVLLVVPPGQFNLIFCLFLLHFC